MILLDFSQVVISNYMSQIKHQPVVEDGLLRHVVLNSIRMYNSQFRDTYGSMVICTDSHNSWRRDVYPYYKASRRRDREASDIDWPRLFETLKTIRDEITETFPYRVIDVEGAEADDVISTLARTFSATEKVVIVSSDKDFQQLQKWKNVSQYNPYNKDFYVCEDPAKFLKEHIIRGDRSDGIPNFLSPDDIFVTEGRQAPIQEKKLVNWLQQEPEQFCDSRMMKNYRRNEQLVDLTRTPKHIQNSILHQYTIEPVGTQKKIYPYLVSHRLSSLVEHLSEFFLSSQRDQVTAPVEKENELNSSVKLKFE